MALTKKQLEEKYDCEIFKDSGFDNSRKYWVAIPNDYENKLFDNYADGWTLQELHANIENVLVATDEDIE